MRDKIETIQDAIYKSESNGWPSDWIVYVPKSWQDELHTHFSNRSPMEVYRKGTQIYGRDVYFDPRVDEPIVLPEDATDVPLSFGPVVKPPGKLVRQVVNTQAKVRQTDSVVRGTQSVSATTRILFDLCNTHRRLNESKIDRFNLPIKHGEYNKQPDEYERVKLAQRTTYTKEFQEIAPSPEVAIDSLVDAVYDTIHSVQPSPIYQTREREFTYPYRCLDFTHREKIRVGTDYKHYGGMVLTPLDTPAKKITPQAAKSTCSGSR